MTAIPNLAPSDVERLLGRLLPYVEKPARYVGGELNQVVKPWSDIEVRMALAFPDLYEIGMANNGLAILYEMVNTQPDLLAERVYLPWTDMQGLMREHGLPLYALESKRPLRDFDILGVSLPYESVYSNLLSLLDLAGLPLRVAERGAGDPLVIAGGHTTFNPEPVAPFVDAFAIGEGEEVILEIARCVGAWKRSGGSRAELHRALARLDGVYVPSLYRVAYHEDGTVAQIEPIDGDVPPVVHKRIVARLPPPVQQPLVPNIETVHSRLSVEIMRGCTRGCRFCHAGMVTRPVRERSVEEVVAALEQALPATGLTEVGLLSLSSSDYSHVLELVQTLRARFGDAIDLSLPSLRIESFSVQLMEALVGGARRGGFTLAPEAATERMRQIINKPVSTEQLLTTAREIYRRGWHTIKLYFMIGHPDETLDDVDAIADACLAVLAEGRAVIGGRAKVNAGVSTFVPKPHTPFQWVPCDGIAEVERKQLHLRRRLRNRGVKLSWNDPLETMLEAWLARGDRRLAAVIEDAWRAGAQFDAWREHFRFEQWQQAFERAGLDPAFYTHRRRALDEVFPWEHLDAGVTKRFLQQDYQWSLRGQTRDDCRDQCYACGILPTFKQLRREHPGPVWECPDVGQAGEQHGGDLPADAVGVSHGS